MALIDEVTQPRSGRPCQVERALVALDLDDTKEFIEVLALPISTAGHQAIVDAFARRGQTVTANAVKNYRKKSQ